MSDVADNVSHSPCPLATRRSHSPDVAELCARQGRYEGLRAVAVAGLAIIVKHRACARALGRSHASPVFPDPLFSLESAASHTWDSEEAPLTFPGDVTTTNSSDSPRRQECRPPDAESVGRGRMHPAAVLANVRIRSGLPFAETRTDRGRSSQRTCELGRWHQSSRTIVALRFRATEPTITRRLRLRPYSLVRSIPTVSR
ncbi:hypothetical protein BC628DRAFT_34127 [Trametes gibbosa]|nr:hypothetical protein BC628DRAFT_34127 [Trametes gibbosa]